VEAWSRAWHVHDDSDDRGVRNGGMLEEQSLELGGRNLVALDLDEFLGATTLTVSTPTTNA